MRPGWRDLGCALGGGGIFGVAVASGWAPLLYPVAMLGAAGVVLAWLLINAVFLVGLVGDTALMRPVRLIARPGWRLGMLAAALAVAELALLAALRVYVGGFGPW
jgi:hypothetical protein